MRGIGGVGAGGMNMFKICGKCDATLPISNFVSTGTDDFYFDGLSPVCNDCIQKLLVSKDFEWNAVNKVCQMLDIPFIPNEWEKIRERQGLEAFPYYARIFQDEVFQGLDWQVYYERFKELQKAKIIERELPELSQDRLKKLRITWGGGFSADDLEYLENLYNGILATQSVTGALQMDQARKICKMSLAIDTQIQAGEDPSKMTQAYDRMIKMANFTAENIKDANDFSSFGEAMAWLERRGWVNEYFDGTNRDIVDEILASLQSFNKRLYTDESSMGDQITDRIQALESAANSISNKAISPAAENDSYDMDKIVQSLDEYDFMSEEGTGGEEKNDDSKSGLSGIE